MTTVLKLGGSVLTHKDDPETVDRDALGRAAAAVAGSAAADDERFVLVHGGGSFGHYHADRHGVSTTRGSRDAGALAAIHGAMGDLNDAVIDALQERGVEALPVRPLSLAYRAGCGGDREDGGREKKGDGSGSGKRDGNVHLPVGGLEAMLAEGFVPVLHGDVVVHEGKGGTILSGDEVVVTLARSLDADRVGLCSTVPGVLDAGGDVIARIDSFADVAGALGTNDVTDVTGGMAGKVRSLLGLEAPAHVFGLDGLPAFLAGEAPGTVVGSSEDRRV